MTENVRKTVCPKCGRPLELDETGRIGWCRTHREWYAVAAGAEGDAAAKNADEKKQQQQRIALEEKERLAREEKVRQQRHAAAMRKVAAIAVAVVLVAAAIVFFIIRPRLTYSSAADAFAAGDYEKAQQIFGDLGSYRDSAQQSQLCAAMIDVNSGDYLSALDQLDLLLQSGSSSAASALRNGFLPIMAKWRENGIPPEIMLEFLARWEIIDPEKTLDFDALNAEAHVALLEGDPLDYLLEDPDEDGENELIVLNSDATLSCYKMRADRNEALRVDGHTASIYLMILGDGQFDDSIDNALACYHEAYRLEQTDETRRKVVSAYQYRADRHEALGNFADAIADAKSAMEISDSAQDFEVFYQTALRCCQNESDREVAIQKWDDFVARESGVIARFGATQKARLDAGNLRLVCFDSAVQQKGAECLSVLDDAAACGADVAPSIQKAIDCCAPGLFRIQLRLKLAEYAADDTYASAAALSQDAKTALGDWRGFGLTGSDTLRLIRLCAEQNIALDDLDVSPIYREAALEASGTSFAQSEFVDWDEDGDEELLALTENSELVYFAFLNGEWTKRAAFSIETENVSFAIYTADAPLVVAASPDVLAAYAWQNGNLTKLFSESGIENLKAEDAHITFERSLPGSIHRSEAYVYDADHSQNRPQRTMIEWQRADYPQPTSAEAAVLRWIEATVYKIPEEQALLTAAQKTSEFPAATDIPAPADISEISAVPYAVYADAALFEVTYAASDGSFARYYMAAQKDSDGWKVSGLSESYSEEAPAMAKMGNEPLLTLNDTLSAEALAKGQSAVYRVLLPKASEVTMIWQAGEKQESRTAFTVAIYNAADTKKPIISYDLALTASKQMSNPLLLSGGVYYVSVTAKTNAEQKYSILLQAAENAYIESESNDTADEADPIEPNAVYTASLVDSSDVDVFAFTLAEPGKVSISMNAADEGKKQNRYQLTVFDASGAALMTAAVPGNVKAVQTSNLYLASGTYLAAVAKGNYFTAASYQIAVNYELVGAQEMECNETPATATPLPLNTPAVGSFGREGDVDYYGFTLDHDALVQPKFSFTPLESSSRTYVLTLMKDGGTPLVKANVGGKESQKVFMPFVLPAGTYILKLENPNFTAQDYTLAIAAQNVGRAECEPNDARAEANLLSLNTEITGMTASEEDVDMYKLVITETTTLTLNFSFATQSQNGTVFSVVLEQNGKTAWNANAKGASGGFSQPLQFAPGEYYIRVKPSAWSAVPYTISAVAQ